MIKLQVIAGVLLCVFLTLWATADIKKASTEIDTARAQIERADSLVQDALDITMLNEESLAACGRWLVSCSRELEDTKRENAELREWLGVLEREIKTLKRQ